jgi:hypothetical protein
MVKSTTSNTDHASEQRQEIEWQNEKSERGKNESSTLIAYHNPILKIL